MQVNYPFIFIVILTCLLASCGLHLRGTQLDLPSELTIHQQFKDTTFSRQLEITSKRHDIHLHKTEKKNAHLILLSEEFNTLVTGMAANTQVTSILVSYRLTYQHGLPKNPSTKPYSSFVLRRITFNASQYHANVAELNALKAQLMQEAITDMFVKANRRQFTSKGIS